MNVLQIIAKARRVAKYSVTNLDQDGALEYLNQIKDEFWAQMASEIFQEDRNFEIWETDTVAGQQEYTLPPLTSTSDGTKALKTVSIAYGDKRYANGGRVYVKADLVNSSSLAKDWDYYVNNQSKENPIYHVSDNSIFIAPVPSENAEDALKMTGIRKIPDYILGTVEQDIGIPVDFHRVLVFGLAYEMVLDKGAPDDDADRALARYEAVKSRAIKALSMRTEGPVTMFYPEEIHDLFPAPYICP